ncbi:MULTISPECIES: 1-aminocyclopropane-1-carboxylate deaminase/D-cysteine desulfhydrase [Pseudonocardia]|uniref:D-cysteine desulfhydrase n=2 Tax=Pseudonocardia TaxID=1847 RepID=A0A1Y2N8I2_PSEAH|nr:MULTISPECIES: pyridoxal-phosphate dependent enzyme [Pseudonocardia]OSY43479.1 D-cysteine desulfhydrase [Pseudonocardia autotrophica]TDN73527.1 D-cysteine desulfhydrase [Pseudonocardia autotrophica]BBG04270.1 D-cysteine desulfhydrase [Pseudonocardia autotrophica]GEC25587.1 D-cysteine desulfhydrase [Pseudonocardia saturnea]
MSTRPQLAALPTPVLPADRLRAALGCAPVWIKRDDLTGFALAGNKARPLEYLLGDALDRSRDLLVTGGGADSNFVPAAALAARVCGLDCEIVTVPGTGRDGTNLRLARAAGARVHLLDSPRRDRIDDAVAELAARRTVEGRRPVAIPRGGSTALGARGFARAAAELADQVGAGLLPAPGLIVIALGSGGSAAGLLAGLAATGLGARLLGVSVSRPPAEADAVVRRLAAECAAGTGRPAPGPERWEVVDARGAGFGIASDTERAAAGLGLRTEGLLLDDTYGAKAFAEAVRRLRAGIEGPVLYWHTGGVASVLAHLPAAENRGERS